MANTLSVVICTYNRCERLHNTLRSLAQMSDLERLSWELLIVDNNSQDATRRIVDEFIRTSGIKTRYLFEHRQGVAWALNTGIAAAQGDVLVFTDDDVEVDRSWLETYGRVFETTDCIGAGGKIIPQWTCAKPFWAASDETYRIRGVFGEFDLGPKSCALTRAPFGANMALRKSVFNRYGCFRTDLGPVGTARNLGGVETEFFSRLIEAGADLLYVPDAVVFHIIQKEQATREFLKSYYISQGRYDFAVHGPTMPRFGVPPYLVRQFIESTAKWIFSCERRRRLYYWLDMYFQLGSIQQAYSMRNESGPQQ